MWEKLKKFIDKLKPAQLIVSYYIIVVTISTLLLCLPVAIKKGADWTLMDAVFTAVSAVSVTGLTTVNFSETFTTTGLFILIFVLQIGGVGIMALGTFFWIVFKRKIGLRERRLIMTDQNQTNLSGLVNLLKQLLVVFIFIELAGALILGTYFLHYFSTWQDAYLHGLFASVTATTNAGFDITGASLIPYANDYFIQFIHMILITLGAIGFPVLIEVKNFFKRKGELFHFTLYTKITTLIYFILVITGGIIFILFEINHFFVGKSWHESFFYAFFQSVSTRSGGLVTLDLTQLSEATLLLLSGLMFIGASPSSVGGGIRTTTFAISLLFLYNFSRGNRTIKLFKREVHEDDIMKAFVVSIFGVIVCFVSVMILCVTEDLPLMSLVFEVCSAFGTSGMSLGITADLSNFGKIIIMLLMFIGRVGILTFIFMIGGKEKKENFHYPKERIIIG
ncbi:TrkH family potassium uptake protein [Bacillus andreraoultii]|uniref:TrkH family potassium uptake protein n=1 Tax=Bacillus andreraoultii TaxID=1499685 RepID=UPI00053A2E98|nr:TrkH family potassium uptake protein [Bacillus andreraoultii]